MSKTPSASKTPSVRRGFKLPCLRCGEVDQVRIYLDDVTATENPITCNNCDGEFTVDEVKGVIAQWSACIAWLESAPVYEDTAE